MRQLAVPLFYVDVAGATALNTAHLRRSLGVADELHAARALASEAVMRAMQRPDRQQDAPEDPLARAVAMSEASSQPALSAWVQYCRATCGHLRGEAGQTLEVLAGVEELLTRQCPGEPWLLLLSRQSLTSAWAQLGTLGANLPRVEQWLAEYHERSDRFGGALLETIGLCSLRYAIRDEPDEVAPRVRAAMAPWPREPFAVPHLGELMCEQFAATYKGGHAAWELLERESDRLRRALVLRGGFGRAVLQVHQAQAALSAYVSHPAGARAASLLRHARAHARHVRCSKAPQARRYALLIDAQLCAIDGDHARALEHVRRASAELSRLQYLHLLSPVAYFEGLLLGGQEGREKRDEALGLAALQGWHNPRRMVAMDCPAIDSLEARSS